MASQILVVEVAEASEEVEVEVEVEADYLNNGRALVLHGLAT